MYLEERLKKLLIEGPPLLSFSAIKHSAPEYFDEELLEFLQKHAILIHGLWTPKSILLYPQGGTGVLVRDIALLLFSKNLNVQSSDLNFRGDISDPVKKMLETFGSETHDPCNPYIGHSRELPDESFKNLYPKIVEKQEKILKAMENQVVRYIGKGGMKRHCRQEAN